MQQAARRELRERRRREREAQVLQTADRWITKVCDGVEWPDNANTCDLSVLETLKFERKADDPADFGNLASYFSEKMERSVAYESGEELKALQAIDRSMLVESFATQSIRLQYRDQGRERAYHPDIFMRLCDGRCLVLEIKDPRVIATYPVLTKAFHMRRKLQPFGIGYHVTSFQGHTIKRLRQLHIDEKIEHQFLQELDKAGVLVSRRVFKVVADLYRGEHSVNDVLQAIVLKHGLAFYERPFRVMRDDYHDRRVFA